MPGFKEHQHTCAVIWAVVGVIAAREVLADKVRQIVIIFWPDDALHGQVPWMWGTILNARVTWLTRAVFSGVGFPGVDLSSGFCVHFGLNNFPPFLEHLSLCILSLHSCSSWNVSLRLCFLSPCHSSFPFPPHCVLIPMPFFFTTGKGYLSLLFLCHLGPYLHR